VLGEFEGDRKGNEIREIGDKTMIEQLKQALQLANEEREKFEAMHEEAERLAFAIWYCLDDISTPASIHACMHACKHANIHTHV
jgi:hypothetical protein